MPLNPSLLGGNKKHAATESLVGLFTVVLGAAVVTALYFAREILIPLSLSALLAFVLAPLVARLERFIGRVTAVLVVVVLVFSLLGAIGWVVTHQALDVVNRLPAYRTNIEHKFKAIKFDEDGPVGRLSKMVSEIESELPIRDATTPQPNPAAAAVKKTAMPAPVPVPAEAPARSLTKFQTLAMPFLSAAGTAGMVVVIVIFMLFKREDLRGRFIKIAGQGRISSTTRAMEDAGSRVSRYLITQLVVNLLFGVAFALGLSLIGLPNAILWGTLAAVLRFIPYVGVWLAALCPLTLALAVSPDWQMLFETLFLFGGLELVTSNLIEPLLYKSSTGVSSLALVVAAVFWTWLWGPMGLLLSTPLTVCLAVVGRHVPRLSFFNILLGVEEPLTPAEDCYHRLLVGGLNDAGKIVDTYLAANSLTALYDSVILPAVTMAEADYDRDELDDPQRARVLQGARDLINDLISRPIPPSQIAADKSIAAEVAPNFAPSDCRVICATAQSERDEVANTILIHLLRQSGCHAEAASPNLSLAQLVAFIEEYGADAVCISVVPPTTLLHARRMSAQLRALLPNLRILVGTWGATENLEDAVKGLQSSGANEVVVSMAEAVVQVAKLSNLLLETPQSSVLPTDEAERVASVLRLEAFDHNANPVFDRMTKKLTQTFAVPIALITLIDRDTQHFKSQSGLPPEAAGICEIPRRDSICTHVVSVDDLLIVEDLSRDRRFSKNPLVQKHHLRFYAGYPLHAPDGQPVGALCLLDTKPRQFGDADRRLLRVLAEEISAELSFDSSVAEFPT